MTEPDPHSASPSNRRWRWSPRAPLARAVEAARRWRKQDRTGRLLGVIPVSAALGIVAPPLDLRILGRTLLHAAVVGLSAGLVGAAFFAGLEYTQAFLLEGLAG